MLTVAKVQYLRELTGNGLEEVKEALLKAEGDPWLAVGILHYKGLAVALRKRLPDRRAVLLPLRYRRCLHKRGGRGR
jgi:translation elongation factor EF-Ts